MENKKGVLITIIVLLCIFAPLTVIGFFSNKDIRPLEDNPKHDQYYDGYMWFYDSNDKFLSKYECQTEICEFANPTIDDTTFGINYYKEGSIKSVGLIRDKYTFITDGSLIYLYAANTGTILQNYKAIKTYNTNIENNSYIIQDLNGVWGVISVSDILNSVLPFEYSFIGLIHNINEYGALMADKFIVQKDTKWYLVDNNNSALTGEIDDPIIDYNDSYIFSKSQDRIRIYSYENYEYLTNYTIKDYILEDKYIGIITDKFLIIYENLGNKYLKSVTLTDKDAKVGLEKDETKLNITIDGNVVETIELS